MVSYESKGSSIDCIKALNKVDSLNFSEYYFSLNIFMSFFVMTTEIHEKSVFETVKDDIVSEIEKGFSALESDQSKVNKAFFEALTMEQRDTFCQTLADSGVKTSRIQKLTGKSQPTINRHLNGKNS